jgi:hypothetical protein
VSACCRRAIASQSKSFSYAFGWSLTYVDLFGAAAESGVVLLDEVPTNLILGNIGSRVVRLGRDGRRVVAGGGVARLYRAIAVLRDEVAIDSGFGSHFDRTKKRNRYR